MTIVFIVVFLLAGIAVGFFVSKAKAAKEQSSVLQFLKASATGQIADEAGMPDRAREIAILIKSTQEEEEIEKSTSDPAVDENIDTTIKERLNNTLIINELGQKITSSLELENTFDHLHHTLNSLMDASALELGVYNEEMERWSVFSNLEKPHVGEYNNHFATWVLKNDRVVFLNDAELDYGRFVDTPLQLKGGEMAQSLMSFPISIDGIVRGTITIISFRKDAFNDYHKDSIDQLLGFLSVALQNAFTHEQLNLLKIRAEQSEKHEQQFLANMSHEIRTPMNAVLGMTNLLLDTPMNEKQVKYLRAINTSSKNLLVIINDILDLSKLEAGKMEIERIPFRIRDVIENVSETNRFKAEEKGLNFEINISPDIPDVVKGDPTRLNQIITNLCSNAIKFTEKGRITISVDQPKDSHFISFRVIDTGIGIPEDKLHLLFSNFKQVDSSTFRKYGGTGLGLSISKTLIELQGGKVEVKSELGKGSEFSVQIPYEVGDVDDVKSLDGDKKSDYSSLTGMRILIAEDNEYNQIVVNDTLESLIPDVHLDIAENGLIALEMATTNEYDAILMDAQMPEMDGLDSTRSIRKLADSDKSKIPIIALTASVHKADIDKCLDAGMDDFVPKPFTRDELLGTLAKYYESANPKTEVKKQSVPAKETPSEVSENAIVAPQNGMVTHLEFLREFAEGDETRMRKYVGMYLKLLPGNLEKIEAATAQNDNELLVKVLHSMRPHLNYMGMKKAAEIAGNIESAVREEADQSFVPEAAQTILNQCKKSEGELNEWLSK
ncbi:ATP-binding protein [Cryomorphaceae bacterium 1068]|nr:ATP-binding protein [Cryomorphaceae bacterium 1068]